MTVLLHIVAGSTALASGAVALYALKGTRLHRTSGMFFVLAMLVMSASGAVMAVVKPEMVSVIAGILTFYLVITGLLTVRRPTGPRWIDFGGMLVALTIGIAGIYFGFEALNSPTGTKDGFPAPPYFIFGVVALVAGLLDIRMLRARGIQGAQRLARHLWRMCFALCIATASLFLGQPQVFPEPIRIIPVLAIPVVLVLLLMLYWLARVLFMHRYRRA